METNISLNQTELLPPQKRFSLILLLYFLSFLLLISTSYLAYQNIQLKKLLNAPTTYEACLSSAGSVLQESYPATCVTASGARFTQPLTAKEQQNLVPLTDETENWKTYTNSGWNITLKLPLTWSDFTTSGGEYFSTDSETKINLRLSKSVVTNNDTYSLAFSTSAGQQIISKENTKVSDITVDGHPAILFSMDYLQNTQEVPSYSYVYVVKDGNFLYTLNFWQDKSQDTTDIKNNIINHKTTFDQILSTFKFTDKTTTTYTCPTNGWVDCMPILDETKKKACAPEAMSWYKANCPNFQGGAL